jgi:hypothetical protein
VRLCFKLVAVQAVVLLHMLGMIAVEASGCCSFGCIRQLGSYSMPWVCKVTCFQRLDAFQMPSVN